MDTLLGKGHFEVPLETIPDERVLWEGGPSGPSAWIRLARAAAIPGMILFFYAWMFLVVLSVDTPRHRAAHAPDAVATSAPAPHVRATTNQDEHPRGLIVLFMPFAFLFLTLLGAIGCVIANAFLHARHDWYVVTTERICIQLGGFTRTLLVIDLDKVLSVQASSSWLERRFGLESVTILQAGFHVRPNAFGMRENNVMAYVDPSERLVTKLVGEWLPRDNAKRG